METGTYIGDGTVSRVINIGFTPKAILIFPKDSAATFEAAASAITGQHSCNYSGVGWQVNIAYFQGIVANGFKTGTNGFGYGTNNSGITFFWMAMKP